MVGWSGAPSNIHFRVLRGWMDGHAASRGGDPPRGYEQLWDSGIDREQFFARSLELESVNNFCTLRILLQLLILYYGEHKGKLSKFSFLLRKYKGKIFQIEHSTKEAQRRITKISFLTKGTQTGFLQIHDCY